jgi:hypothetical protein
VLLEITYWCWCSDGKVRTRAWIFFLKSPINQGQNNHFIVERFHLVRPSLVVQLCLREYNNQPQPTDCELDQDRVCDARRSIALHFREVRTVGKRLADVNKCIPNRMRVNWFDHPTGRCRSRTIFTAFLCSARVTGAADKYHIYCGRASFIDRLVLDSKKI